MSAFLKGVINLVIRKVRHLKRRFIKVADSSAYWESRYKNGGNSGSGSYGRLAQYKAKFLNKFVDERGISSVIEFGCGDGNQLELANYPNYIGFDVSSSAVEICRNKFKNNKSKQFSTLDHYSHQKAQLTLSIDVIYHLVEQSIYERHLAQVFDASLEYVIVYSSNKTDQVGASHVKHRKFTDWVDVHRRGWKLVEKVENTHPYQGDVKTGSFACFYIYEKR